VRLATSRGEMKRGKMKIVFSACEEMKSKREK
jgi:hypothetical protein